MGFFSFIGRGFKHLWGIFGDLFKSEALKFVARYKQIFLQAVTDVAEGQLEGDRNKQEEAVAKLKSAFKGIGVDARDSFLNLGIEIILAELKSTKRIP